MKKFNLLLYISIMLLLACNKSDDENPPINKTELLCQKWSLIAAYANNTEITKQYDYYYTEFKRDSVFTDYVSKNSSKYNYISDYEWRWNDDKTGYDVSDFFNSIQPIIVHVKILELSSNILEIEYTPYLSDTLIRRMRYKNIDEIEIPESTF